METLCKTMSRISLSDSHISTDVETHHRRSGRKILSPRRSERMTVVDECFVCNDDTSESPLLSNLCSCTDRYIHIACQRRLLDTCETDGKCSVCRTTYANVRAVNDERVTHRIRMLSFHLLRTLSIVLCAALIILFMGDIAATQLLCVTPCYHQCEGNRSTWEWRHINDPPSRNTRTECVTLVDTMQASRFAMYITLLMTLAVGLSISRNSRVQSLATPSTRMVQVATTQPSISHEAR